MLRLADDWVWDFWIADDGERWHAFFLKAPRALGDPELRHVNATIGHAVSSDLEHWEVLGTALAPSPAPAFDDLATWTGCVVRHGDAWRMFTTAVTKDPAGRLVQRITWADSPDLMRWTKSGRVVAADPRWYEVYADGPDADEAWRDPWVMPDPDGGWRMFLTARARSGEWDDRGVIATAWSPDLDEWTVQPPLSSPGAGFFHLEVLQIADILGGWTAVFSCPQVRLAGSRAAGRGGVWAVEASGPLGPFDVDAAHLLLDEELYVGRLVPRSDGTWVMLAFHNIPQGGEFIGELSDPMPVMRGADGRLAVAR